jgi:protein SCO1
MTKARRLLLLAATSVLVACGAEKKAAFKGIDITGAEYAQRLDLPDIDGKVRTLADFKGKATIVFFGYVQCPDVCPGTLAEVAQARQMLGADAAKVQTVFVTVDPERDTPEVLKGYVGSFGTDVVALRGTLEQTQAAAKAFKVFFAKVPGRSPDTYTMDHPAGAFVFDPKGRVRLFVRYGTGAEPLAQDLKLLIAGA